MSVQFYSATVQIDPNGDQYVVNERGAKVYLDESKQPVLHLKEGANTRTVLSVGLDRSRQPIATIQEKDGAVCYRLPDWYVSWCESCILIATIGVSMFPGEVVFTKDGDQYSVYIL